MLSKLTMCVCAAGTGAALVPTAHAVQRHLGPHARPAVHRAATAPHIAAPALTSTDCPPAVALLDGGLGGASGAALTGTGVQPVSSDGFPFGPGGSDAGGGGFFPGGGFGGGFGGSGGGSDVGGGGLPGGSGGGMPGGGGGGTPPSASNAPEPASWALMVAGFAVAGGVMRARTRAAA